MATTYVPAILGVVLTPNPAPAGTEVLVSVHAVEVAQEPYTFTWTAGELNAGVS